MKEHDDHVHDHEPLHRQRKAQGAAIRSDTGPILPNSALSRMLGRVDRAATRSQGAGPLNDEIAADITAARGGGHSLEDSTRADMEGHLGVDLSSVRVHTDGVADTLSRSVQAEAFTTGTDVFFRNGAYQPGSTDGRRLLAHELTHVVQQSTGSVGRAGEVSHPDDPHEREASAVADGVASAAPAVHREATDEELDED